MQLKRMNLVFSDQGKSSSKLCDFLLSDYFEEIKDKYPTIQFKTLMKRNSHPFLTGIYVNGYVKDVPLRLRSFPEIVEDVNFLISSCLLKRWTSSFKARRPECIFPSKVHPGKMD